MSLVVTPKNYVLWFLVQAAMVSAVVLFSIFAVFAVTGLALSFFNLQKSLGEPWVLPAVALLVVAVTVALRREYIFTDRFEFSHDAITVRTLFGAQRVYSMREFSFVPSLHKTIGIPQHRASLSFYIRRRSNGKDWRNFAWFGFSREDFARVSRLYGYDGATDYDLWKFGK